MTGPQAAEKFRAKPIRGKHGQWIAKCPAHPDKHPSLSIREGKKGVMVTCRAGCDLKAICSEAGIRVRDLFYDSRIGKDVIERLTLDEEFGRHYKAHCLALWLEVVEPKKRNYWKAVQKRTRADCRRLWPLVYPLEAYRLKRRRERLQQSRMMGLDAYFDREKEADEWKHENEEWRSRWREAWQKRVTAPSG